MYIANWASDADADAINDDRQSTIDIASPAGVIVRRLTKAAILKLQTMALEDTMAYYEEDKVPRPSGAWELLAPVSNDFSHYRWESIDHSDVVHLIISKREVL